MNRTLLWMLRGLMRVFVRPAVVPEDALARLEHASRDLRLDVERIRPEVHPPQDVGADRLVARLHVGQHRVVEDVRQPGQALVGHEVPVEKDPVAPDEP